MNVNGRPCGQRKSKALPDAYSKEELISLVAKRLGVDKSKLTKIKKADLCTILILGKTISPKKKTRVAKKTKDTKEKSKVVKKKTKITTPKKKMTPSKKKVTLAAKKKKISPKKVTTPKIKTLTVRPKKECVERSKIPLHEHQRRAVEFMKTHRGLLVSWAVGQGKTLAAVTAAECYLDKYPKGHIVVVTPLSLQQNFKDTVKKYGADPNDPRYEYLTLQKFANVYKDKNCSSDTFLIIDEAHNLRTKIIESAKKQKGIRAAVVIRCAQRATKVMLLTGTPVYNSPRDIMNLVAIVRGVPAPTEKQTLDILSKQSKIDEYFRCSMSIYDAPLEKGKWAKLDEHYIEIEMTQNYYKEYMKVERANSPYYDIKNPWIFLVGMRQASNAIAECLKCDFALKKIKEGKKTILYSAFLGKGIEQMKTLLKKEKIKFVEISGKTPKDERTKAVRGYNKGLVNVLILTKAGGEGLDLKGTRNVILFEKSWNRPAEEQVIGRARRYGAHVGLPEKEQHVSVYHLVAIKPKKTNDAHKSADEYLLDIINEKTRDNEKFVKQLMPLMIEKTKCS
jgi:SNF2 family DNA or RNA helicase